MAPPTGAVTQGPADQRPAAEDAKWGIGSVLRMLAVFWLIKQFFGGSSKSTPSNAVRTDYYWPKFNKSESVDFFLFGSDNSRFTDVSDASKLIWTETNIPLAASSDLSTEYLYRPSKGVQNNGTFYLYAYLVRSGKPVDRKDPAFDPDSVAVKQFQLNTWMPKQKSKQGINLLSGQDSTGIKSTHEEQAEQAAGPREYVSYLKPNLTIAMVDDFSKYPAKSIPQPIAEHMTFDPVAMEYYPTIFFNDFWLLKDYLIPMNESVTEVPLSFTLSSMTLWKFTLFSQMDQAFGKQQSWGAMGEGESDEFKRVLLEGNPYFLALTFSVSLLHSVFDFFAFKNDIGFWKNKKSVEGLSVRSIGLNAIMQLIIFLYLLDNETSTVVLFSAGIGCAIEFWKVTKAMTVSIDWSRGIPLPKFEDKAGYNNASETKKHDADAVRYLSYVLYPLLAGYAVYALFYETHKSWYSFVLNTLVGAVYMFGFILMCPQLYINYKLKSVAALPWRQMTFKFLNTIIDDLFAFVIKMPWLHRLSVFRDDLVFLVYIYQRYAYRVDKKRPNEFGYVAEADPEEIEGEAPQLVPLTQGEDSQAAETGGSDKKPLAASEGTPLLADRAGERAHQPVGDTPREGGGDRGEVSTLGEDFVDLGDNAIISELEPERTTQHAGEAAQPGQNVPSVAEVLDAMKVPSDIKKSN
ncbi:hypothetical protein WJX82_010310 [Trebouxia sp. C0006]